MAQDIIDIGPQPNDGQGDNLRTAFDKTNDNFTQIWTAGPVGSNVRVAGNVISTLQVNQDLALSPNGVGNVRLNNNTIPGANNTWFLGSATMQWRGLYAASVETGNITITGTLDVPGDAVIQGNLTVEGNTIQIGNIVTDTKTIQLANTAANTIQANGSGITVGASDNIATFLYNSTSNSWVTNLQITNANGQPIGTTPGGSNTYIQFNDAGNFGGNANFTYNRATGNFYLGGANLRAVSGNNQPYILQVPGIAFQGGQAIMEWNPNNQHIAISNSLSISGTLAVYGNYPNVGALLATSGGSGVDITIEPSGNLYLNADGGEVIVSDQTVSVSPNSGALKVLGGIGVNGNINAGGNISAVGWTGNLIPSANAVYSLGNSTKYWANLWVANNTIYIGGVPLGMTAGNVLTVGGNAVLSNNSNTAVSTTGNITAGNVLTGGVVSATGNITANYFVGNGSLLTGLAATYGNANVVANLAALGSNPISTTGNITANYFVGNGRQLTSVSTSFENEIHVAQNGNDTSGDGTINYPYLTIQKGVDISATPLTDRRTVVVHPGTYIENVTVTFNNTQIITYDLTGASTTVSGTLTLANNAQRLAGLKITNLIIAGNTQAYINSCTVTGQLTKSSSGYVEMVDVDMSVSGNVQITGGGTTLIDSNKIVNLRVANASASVSLRNVNQVYSPEVTAGTLSMFNCFVQASGNTANAITASVGTVLQLFNTTIYNLGLTAPARISVGGFYQLSDTQYDRANSVLGTSLGAISFFQSANIDSVTVNTTVVATGNVTGGNVLTGGLISATGNVTGNYILGNGSQLTAVNAATVDVTDTNGLTTVYYPTFVENRTTAQITRADIDLSYRTDTNTLTVGNISTGKITLTNGAVIRDTAGDSVSFGQNAGNASQGSQAVAIGLNAGANSQAAGAVAVGVGAGQLDQGITGIAIGDSAGYNTQGPGAVAIGAAAGFDSQGQYSVAMGYYAGNTNQANNSIIINATGANLNQTTANTFTVAPVRNDVANIGNVMFYNTTSKEITYGNVISVAGNVTGGNLTTAGIANVATLAVTGSVTVQGSISISSSSTSLSATGNVIGGNLLTGGLISATGNVSGGNLNVTGNIVDTGALSIITGSNGNIALAPNGTGIVTVSSNLSVTGNISANNLALAGNITSSIGFTGATITINNAPGGNEGAEVIWALPSAANTVLNTSLIQDVYQNGMRFFEAGGNSRGLYMDLGNVPNGAGTAVGYRDIPQVSFAANATIAATDAGRHYYSTSASNLTLTIANNTSVSWVVGTAITVVNRGSGNITVAQGTGVSLYLAGNSSAANRTVSTYGMATLLNVAANVWMINGTGVA